MARGAPIPCRIRGVVYPSIREAARQLGLSQSTISQALEDHDGEIDHVGKGRFGPKPAKIYAKGHVYQSAKDAANAIGVTVQSIYQAKRENRLGQIGTYYRKHMS